MGLEDYFLLGYLNSSLGWYEISRHCTPIQNGYQLIWDYFKNVRVPIIQLEQQSIVVQIEAVVRQLIEANNNPQQSQRLESQLNQLVFDVYGLKHDEIEFIHQKLGSQISDHDANIETIRESYDEGWLVVEVTASDPKTLLPERGIVRFQTPKRDQAFAEASRLEDMEFEAKPFYVFFNGKEE